MNLLYFISAIISIIVLLILFTIPYRIKENVIESRKTNKLLQSLLDLKEQDIKSRGLTPEYSNKEEKKKEEK